MALPYTVIPADATKPVAAFVYAGDALVFARQRGTGTRIKLNGYVVFKTTIDNRYEHLHHEAVLEIAENYRLALAKRQARYAGYVIKREERIREERIAAAFATTEN